MKKLLSILALALCFVACQNEGVENVTNDGLVDVVLTVDAPELGVTRADGDENAAKNSAFGAIDFLTDADWKNYDLRYILEVYDANETGSGEPIYRERLVNCLDKYAPTTFALRLVPNRDYKFVVFADFVAEGSAEAEDKLAIADLYYNTADLRKVTAITTQPTWNAMNEVRDAYFITKNVKVTTGLNETLTLTRPFAKLRVIATDLDYITGYSKPGYVEVTYKNEPIYKSFNAVNGELTTEEMAGNELSYSFEVNKNIPYTAGYDKESTNQTLFTDYLLAVEGTQTTVNFEMNVYESKGGRLIHSHDFNTQIPIQRNHLTTIIGDLLTTQANITIEIDDNFEDEFIVSNLWDGTYATLPAANAEGYIEIETPGQLATLLTMDPEGMKVRLMNDVNFDGYELKIYRDGAKGHNTAFEFDGNGKVISNFTVSEGQAAGLFADLVMANVHDLTIMNAVVAPGAATRAAGDFYAGALVGRTYGECTFTNINVVECEIEGVNKVGGLIGTIAEDAATITNCVVEGSKVGTQSTEDGGCVAGLVGYVAGNGTVIENSVVRNTEINAINSANEAKRANAELVGTFHGGKNNVLTLTDNTCENNTFNEAETSYVAPEGFRPWLGGIRTEGANVILNGASIVAQPIATPDVKATVEGNVVTLTWTAIENAAKYGITVGTEMPAFVEGTTYVFTGEYETEYTFNVVAVPADEETYAVSEAAVVTATTEAEPQPETPVAGSQVSVAKFLEMADTATEYVLTGKVARVVNTQYGNFDLTDETGTIYIYGLVSPTGAAQYWAESGVREGDTITVKGKYSVYNNSPQVKNAVYVSHVPAPFVFAEAAAIEADVVEVSISVESNVAWTVSCDAAWVKSYSKSGTDNSDIDIEVEANTTTQNRVATFTISGEGVADYTVTLTQYGAGASDTKGTYTSEAFFKGGTDGGKSYQEKVNVGGTEYDCLKLGTSSVIGKYTTKAVGESGDLTLSFYAVGWNGKTSKLNVYVDGVKVGETLTLKGNSGAANNAPYTITPSDTTDYYSISVPGITETSKITFETVSGATRAIIFGVQLY